jgi:serine protease Do
MLKIEADNLPVPQWVPREELQVGQTVVALGVALPGDQPTLTVGIISALNRMLGNAVQTDAKLSPANYGGPLIDLKGRVVGLCVPMAQRPGELAGVKLYDSGVGFAVPYDRITEIGEQLRAGQSFWRGWLGVQFNPRYTGGLFIRAIANPSPIYAAGVRPGDIITWVNGRTVKSGENLVKAIYMLPAGEPIQMCITRNDRSMGLTTTLARAKDLGQLEQLQPKLPDRTPWQRRPLAPWRR